MDQRGWRTSFEPSVTDPFHQSGQLHTDSLWNKSFLQILYILLLGSSEVSAIRVNVKQPLWIPNTCKPLGTCPLIEPKLQMDHPHTV